MPYKILENIAYADLAVEVTAGNLPELFHEAAEAVQSLQFEIQEIKPRVERQVELKDYRDAKELLYDFLSEIIVYKDSEALALGKFEVVLEDKAGVFSLQAQLWGEKIDPKKHTLHDDIKAITRHMFELKQEKGGWKALIVVDV